VDVPGVSDPAITSIRHSRECTLKASYVHAPIWRSASAVDKRGKATSILLRFSGDISKQQLILRTPENQNGVNGEFSAPLRLFHSLLNGRSKKFHFGPTIRVTLRAGLSGQKEKPWKTAETVYRQEESQDRFEWVARRKTPHTWKSLAGTWLRPTSRRTRSPITRKSQINWV